MCLTRLSHFGTGLPDQRPFGKVHHGMPQGQLILAIRIHANPIVTVPHSLQAEVEFVRAIEDHCVQDATLLSFRKGDVIRIVRSRNMHISKGNSSCLPFPPYFPQSVRITFPGLSGIRGSLFVLW